MWLLAELLCCVFVRLPRCLLSSTQSVRDVEIRLHPLSAGGRGKGPSAGDGVRNTDPVVKLVCVCVRACVCGERPSEGTSVCDRDPLVKVQGKPKDKRGEWTQWSRM